MRYYFTVWIGMILIFSALALVDFKLYSHGNELAFHAKRNASDLEMNRATAEISKNAAKTKYVANIQGREFLKEWRPYYESGLSVSEVVQWLSSKAPT